ncbi:hypothetical protein NC652_002399 [Populus alba x Populus x berolinensis]|nr:hypothetical protein NC652_002399 [Populus alba x Populus x berolinensis]
MGAVKEYSEGCCCVRSREERSGGRFLSDGAGNGWDYEGNG